MTRKSPFRHKVKKHIRKGRTVHTYDRGKGNKPKARVIQRHRVGVERNAHKVLTEDLRDLTNTSKKYLDRGKPVPKKLQIAISRAKGRLRGKSRYTKTKIIENTSIGVHAFTANFKYSEKPNDGESLVVFADSYSEAMKEAYEERVDKHRNPIEVELVDPSIGAALSFLGRGAKSIGGLAFKGIKQSARVGAKYAIKAAKAVPGAAARTVKKGAIFGARFGVEIGKTAFTAVQKRDAQRLLKDSYNKTNKTVRFFARKTLKRRYPEIYDLCHFSKAKFKPPSEDADDDDDESNEIIIKVSKGKVTKGKKGKVKVESEDEEEKEEKVEKKSTARVFPIKRGKEKTEHRPGYIT